MNKLQKSLVVVATTLAMLGSFVYSVEASPTISFKSTISALDSLKVADEDRTGYKRDNFKHWISAGNGCDSRKAVIISEAIVKPSVLTGCVLKGGEWLSIYDNVKVTDAGKLDVDHMVPLAEAWDSGAQAWDAKKREVYANDQTDPRHLIAVTGGSNRSKSDRDPAEWVPTNTSYVCEYLANWVAVKARWNLSVDSKEKSAIISLNKKCKVVKITITKVG
jgi:hypothetical protein